MLLADRVGDITLQTRYTRSVQLQYTPTLRAGGNGGALERLNRLSSAPHPKDQANFQDAVAVLDMDCDMSVEKLSTDIAIEELIARHELQRDRFEGLIRQGFFG